MGVIIAITALLFGPFLGALLYAALFQRDQIRWYREHLHVGGPSSEWSQLLGYGEPW